MAAIVNIRGREGPNMEVDWSGLVHLIASWIGEL